MCILFSADAQPPEDYSMNRNGIYAEFYPFNSAEGLGLISINYEFIFYKRNMRSLSLGIYPDFEQDFVALPLTLSRITNPQASHHFEYGLGVALTLTRFNNKWWTEPPFFLFPLMYRYQKAKGFFFRGGLNLILGYGGFLPHPSVSFGYRFL